MKKKIVGIFIVTLLIATAALPVVGTMNASNTKIVGEIPGSDDQPATWINANYMPVLTDEEYEKLRRETYKEITSDLGWYWKPSYPNYAPSGMPDFSQKQDQWKTIFPGVNGTLDSTPAGDDVISSDGLRIAPGPNCTLETTPAGDDVVKYSFCSPTAVANCLWWFDSKYADPKGKPGDGKDNFTLVQNYTVGDDHSKANVPELICRLANAMNTCKEGLTNVTDVQKALDQWFNDTGLNYMFEEKTYYKPTFSFIESEIKRSQDVILSLGYYNRVKTVDQQQIRDDLSVELTDDPEALWQQFFPSQNILDAVQVKLVTDPFVISGTITAYIWSSTWTLLGSSTRIFWWWVSVPKVPTWFQFHFDPSITLIPFLPYYITVTGPSGWYWRAWIGAGDWYDGLDTSSLGGPHDFTFKTEYYSGYKREYGHSVTCAGVNSEKNMIAFSDPAKDQVSTGDHNDAINVSHDIYNVSIGCPIPNLDYKWWLPDYSTEYDFTIVEKAVVICPKPPDTTPPSVKITKPEKAIYLNNNKITPFFIPIIIGAIDIDVQATDAESGMKQVEFYIDNVLKSTDTTSPYSWTWSTMAFFSHTIKAVACDNAGNTATDEITVWKFF